jgi:hypothetical protein
MATGIEALSARFSIARGLLQTLSKTASSADPVLHFKVTASKEYAQAEQRSGRYAVRRAARELPRQAEVDGGVEAGAGVAAAAQVR